MNITCITLQLQFKSHLNTSLIVTHSSEYHPLRHHLDIRGVATLKIGLQKGSPGLTGAHFYFFAKKIPGKYVGAQKISLKIE